MDQSVLGKLPKCLITAPKYKRGLRTEVGPVPMLNQITVALTAMQYERTSSTGKAHASLWSILFTLKQTMQNKDQTRFISSFAKLTI
jgi:hypothetical protein